MTTEINNPITAPSADITVVGGPSEKPAGMRVNGKQWKATKTPFRPKAGKSKSWDVKQAERTKLNAMKAKEKEMKDEKEAERQARIKAIKDKKEAKAEKERYEMLAAKMHKKRVERLKRKEKRNKLLKER
ncbi:hypothetical protein BJ508DRAFT_414729 [Ascobolus immersus RN42]|uniref:rRNA-processing protein n=1 Tax=Ascobolus immersus RN42 TaxID=1160509 RepID=A0A3N4I5W7_ASCIM|nr:hypothetical protein BJ508DRAFT_414729 [Ascobolus immersus RN42]